MKRFAKLLPALLGATLSVALIAGCTTPPGTIIKQNGSATGSGQTSEQQSAAGTTANQGAPAISTADPSLPATNAGPDAPVSSTGEIGTGADAAGAPVAIDSGAAGAEGGAGGNTDVTGYETYRNDACGFTIGYPIGGEAGYIVQEVTNTQGTQTVCRVVFQTKHLAESDTAALQPPQFLIEVYDAQGQQDLNGWLDGQGVTAKNAANWTVEAVKIDNISGLKVTNMQMLAPNEFIYVLKGSLVYKLTPLGPYSRQMLDSFTFTR